MRSLLSIGARLRDDKRAVTALEYGMMATLIALAVAAGVTQLGATALALWTTVATLNL